MFVPVWKTPTAIVKLRGDSEHRRQRRNKCRGRIEISCTALYCSYRCGRLYTVLHLPRHLLNGLLKRYLGALPWGSPACGGYIPRAAISATC